MKKLLRKMKIPLGLLLTGFLMFLAFILIGGALRPDLDEPLTQYPQEEIDRVLKARSPKLVGDDPPVQWQDVDYAEGSSAPWWPSKQSPLLDPLVESGTLPDVAERVGPQPLVMKGVEGTGEYGGTLLTNRGAASFPGNIEHMHSYCTLIRWSPQGYPFVPHVARAFEANARDYLLKPIDDGRLATHQGTVDQRRRRRRHLAGHP